MDEPTLRMVFAVAGFVAGLMLGWTSRAARDAQTVREAVVTTTSTTNKRRRITITRTDAILGVLVLITLAATFLTVQTNNRIDRIATCNQRVAADLIRAVNERTSYASESAERNGELQRSARGTVTAVLDRRGTVDQRRERVRDALESYGDALAAFEKVQAKSAKQRRAFPYPTDADINRCR